MSTDVDKICQRMLINCAGRYYGSDKSISGRRRILFSSYPQGFAAGPNASRAVVIRVSRDAPSGVLQA